MECFHLILFLSRFLRLLNYICVKIDLMRYFIEHCKKFLPLTDFFLDHLIAKSDKDNPSKYKMQILQT